MAGVPSVEGEFKASPQKWLPSISRVRPSGQQEATPWTVSCESWALMSHLGVGQVLGRCWAGAGLTSRAEEVVGPPPAICPG